VEKPSTPVRCYIAATVVKHADSYLTGLGVGIGLVHFAVPALGLQFRARVQGSPLDLEFGAFFSLLQFLKGQIKDRQVKDIVIASSSAEFVYAFAGRTAVVPADSERERMIREYRHIFQIAVVYVPRRKNKSLSSPGMLPSVPKGGRADVFDLKDADQLAFGDPFTGTKL